MPEQPRQRRTGDTTRQANHSEGRGRRHKDAAAPVPSSSRASGVTPLLLSRLQNIFDSVNSKDFVLLVNDTNARAERLKAASKEVFVIRRAACALPEHQRAMVEQLADNIKSVLGVLKGMSSSEVAAAAERFRQRQSSGTHVETDLAAEPQSNASDLSATDDNAAAATIPDSTAERKPEELIPRFLQWSTLLRSSEFAAGTADAKQRAIIYASADIKHATEALEAITDDALLDRLIAVIEDATDAVMAAKRLAARSVPPSAASEATAAATDTPESREDDDSFSVSALNEVLREFHDALNADELLQVEPGLRVTLVDAILTRLREIEVELVPNVRGSEQVKTEAASAVATLINRALRLQQI